MLLAVPLGVAASVVYGTSIVVQHRTAQQHADEGGETSASSLLRLFRNPLWLIAVFSDFAGFLLQAAALSAGAVVVIQPLVVLMLPVALAVSFFTGGDPPRVGGYPRCLAGVGGPAVFLRPGGQAGGGP